MFMLPFLTAFVTLIFFVTKKKRKFDEASVLSNDLIKRVDASKTRQGKRGFPDGRVQNVRKQGKTQV